MKQFLAAMAMLFVSVLAIWVALRLAPETWAMIAGVIFGILASLPMCAVVVILLRRDNRPAAPVYYQAAPAPDVIDARPAGYAVAGWNPGRGAYLPAPAGPAATTQPVAPRRFVDRAAGLRAAQGYDGPLGLADAPYSGFPSGAPWEEDAGDPAAWEMQPAPRPPRILG